VRGRAIKVLALPREGSNPYQQLLYEQMERLGARTLYVGCRTPSHTLNLLLLPAELACRRLTGWRLVHLHWVFNFALPGSTRYAAVRWLSQAWFAAILWWIRLLRFRLVWTAHNVVPHDRVFANDITARQWLVAASDLVIAHSQAALAELAALGASPRRSAAIPHGPYTPSSPVASLRIPGTGDTPRQILFVGKVQAYKGAENLVRAFLANPECVQAQLTVAGECPDPRIRSALETLASKSGGSVNLQLDRLPDQALTSVLQAADVVVLPFERITTSGSAMLALCHGRPLIVPAGPALADLPDDAVVRYDGSTPGLAAALAWAAGAQPDELAAMSAAALAYTSRYSWADVAATTIAEMAAMAQAQPLPAL
jgi:glycosyltransferase involved in cell wall biosynthesis